MGLVMACSQGGTAPATTASGGSATPPPVASGAPSASPATIEAALVELERLKTAMCACAETRCTDGVTGDLERYRPTLDATVRATPPTTEQAERIAKLEDEMRGCRRWVAAGLGSNSGGGETNAMFEIALVELERYRNQMCACADPACGDRVARAHDAWRAKTDAELGDRKPTASQTERRATYEQGYRDCRAKL